MKKTLTVQLAEAQRDAAHYRERYDESYKASGNLHERIKELERGELSAKMTVEMWRKDLLEIIRWQANPETAKNPFKRDKEQRSEKDYGDNYRQYTLCDTCQ